MIRCEVVDSGLVLEMKIVGEGDIAHAVALQEQIASVTTIGRNVVVNLDGLTCLDGAGVQILIALKTFIVRNGGVFRVLGHSESALRAIETAGAADILGLRN
jgi:anti-sigma B factor antagonist